MAKKIYIIVLLLSVVVLISNTADCWIKKLAPLNKPIGKRRQAIPLAVVQSGALGDMTMSKEKKKNENETIDSLYRENYLNCPQYLLDQVKIDKKLKQDGAYLNITESAYNASVARALDSNKTTVTFNKTIQLLQNATDQQDPPSESFPEQILDKTTSKLIYVSPLKEIKEIQQNTSQDKLEMTPHTISTNKSINKSMAVDTNKTVTLKNSDERRRNDIVLNKRVVLTLPHVYNMHSSVSIERKRKFENESVESEVADEEDKASEVHGILLGPLDDLPDNPSGNGPQEKKRKNLEATNAHRKLGRRKKKKHPKGKEKRQTYNFNLSGMTNDPFPFTMDSERFERNFDYRDINQRSYSPRNAAYETNLMSKQYPTLAAAYVDNKNQIASSLFEKGPAKEMRASIHENNWPSMDNQQFNYDQQPLYSGGAPTRSYGNYGDNEASHEFTTPKMNDVDGVFNSQSHPIGAPEEFNQQLSNSESHEQVGDPEPVYKPENFLESSIQKIFADNTGLQAHVPEGEMSSFAQKITSPTSLAEFRSKQTYGSGPPYLFDSGTLATRGAIPEAPPATQELAARMLQDKRIQSLLNQYDAQTRNLATLFNRNRNQQIVNKFLGYNENPMQPRFQPPSTDVSSYIPNQMVPRRYQQENEMLSDPDSRSRGQLSMGVDSHQQQQQIFSNGNAEEAQTIRDALLRQQQNMQKDEYQQSENENRNMINGDNSGFQQQQQQQQQQVTGEADQRNSIIHSNLLNEFLKFFAYKNGLTSQLRSSMSSPYSNQFASSSQQAPLSQSPYEFPGVPRDSLPTIGINDLVKEVAKQVAKTNNDKDSTLAPIILNPTTPMVGTDDLTNGGGITNQKGVVMLVIKSAEKETDNDAEEAKKEVINHKELTKDGVTRLSSNVTDDDRDFSVNLKKAADFVLDKAVSDGNISTSQKDEIQHKLTHLLDKKYKNKTRGEIRASTRASIPKAYSKYCEDTMHDCNEFKAGGVCPFMRTFMRGTCRKSCDECSMLQYDELSKLKVDEFVLKKDKNIAKQPTLKRSEKPSKPTPRSMVKPTPQPMVKQSPTLKRMRAPSDPVMYLTFEKASRDGVIEDESTYKNNAMLENGAQISPRVLGTCGRAAELNEGSVSWSGDEFRRKPDTAISISMWVKVRKGGVINWFANGKKGDKMFYARTKGTVVPAKVWTHVAGTFDSTTGLARIYINGNLEQEQQQHRGQKLAKNWLVNGIGANFGDDSLHYVDEVTIYDRALANSEIRMLFNRCSFNRMVLHFGFQKGNKTNINDQSGLDNNAILIGGGIQRENCDRCGYCLDLTRGPDPTMKIQQISEKQLPKYKISIAVWVSLNSTKGVHNIFTTESSDGNIGYRLQVIHGKIRWAIGTDNIPVIFDNMTRAEVVPEALWTHIIATYNNENGVTKIYANSMLKFKDVVPEEKRTYLPHNWDNDASIGDHTLRGYLDEFIMYNWELDDSEALYVRNYCADHPKLVRFTVRVPLTKKTLVPRPKTIDKRSILPKKDDSQFWWYLYSKLLNEKLGKSKKSLVQTPVPFPKVLGSKIPVPKNPTTKVSRQPTVESKRKKDTVKQYTMKKLRELALDPNEAFSILKK